MTAQTNIQPTTDAKRSSQPIPAGTMENLSARVRDSGLYVVLVRPDATIEFHDSLAASFFQKYVLPMMQRRAGDSPVRQQIASITADTGVVTFQPVPDVIAGAFPQLNRKSVCGVVMVLGKSESFSLGEDVLRACGQVSIDAQWLQQQAAQLPGYGVMAISRQAQLLGAMLADLQHAGLLEQELNSLSVQLSNTYEELSLIYQLSSGMRVNRRASDFFRQACVDVMDVMGVRGMGAVLRVDTSAKLEPVLYGDSKLPQATLSRLAEQLMAVLQKRSTPLLLNNLTRDKHFAWLAGDAQRLLAVPLQRQEQLLGCMFALDKSTGDFDTVDSKLLNSIGNESAIYLENSMLFEDVRGLMMGLLRSLTSAVDAKDAYTCGHSERVALLSRYLAQQFGLEDHAVERVYMAGLLHDVGKIGVPEAVLKKAGKLTEEEFDEIKKHPEIGARILRDVKQIEDIIPGVLHHHERYDGKGYPAGLAGEAIPLMGRIICLADCFDAMTSSRTYRKALPLETALEEIKRCSGSQFDPKLADAFLSISAEQFKELLANHQEQSKRLIEMQQNLRAAGV